MKKQKLILIILIIISLGLFGLIYKVERLLRMRVGEVFVQAPYRPANIIVNTNREYGPLPGIWQAVAQGGEEGGGARMLAPTVSLMKKTGVQYIRLDHIFDDDYYAVYKSKGSYDWSKLDATVDDITSMGAKPFFSLSYMPSTIASSKISIPNNWGDWTDLVRGLVSHYSGKIEGIYYEVWNEPSLDQFGGFKMYGDKDYRELYKYSVLGASQASGVKAFKIGGPAIPVLDPTWVRLLFDYCLTNNLRLDFVSWHRYGFNPDIFVDDVYQINIILDNPKYVRFKKIEKVITEWGPNSEKDKAYSGNVAASHAISVIRKLIDKTNYIYSFEVKDGPGQGEMGWGLLTHESAGGIKEKPRYFLYDWLSELKGKRVEMLGEGTNVTGLAVNNKGQTLVILTNYNALGGQEESFPVKFTGLTDGQYRVLIQKLFGNPEEKEMAVSGGTLDLNVSLGSYEVMRIRVTRI